MGPPRVAIRYDTVRYGSGDEPFGKNKERERKKPRETSKERGRKKRRVKPKHLKNTTTRLGQHNE